MKMNEFEKALDDYTQAKALAEINLDDVPQRVRSGREAQKREAQQALEGLKAAYAKALATRTFGVFLSGDCVESFVDLAPEEAELVVVDASALYKRLTEQVSKSMGSAREFGVSQYSLLIQGLRSVAMELNIDSLPSPIWTEPVSVADEEGLFKHIRSMIESKAGLDLLVLHIKSQIVEKALAGQFSRNTVPVIVVGASSETVEPLSQKLFIDGRKTDVKVDKPVSRDSVLDVFEQIKKQIKTNKKK